jgi:hypothetical protein
MQSSTPNLLHTATLSHKPLSALTAICLAFCTQFAAAASIEGRAINFRGEPLYKVSVCLSENGSAGQCTRVRWTDKKGNYSFTGIKPDGNYDVVVNGDTSAANRKMASYANYVWEPALHTTAIQSQNDKVTLADFVGKFNFSNFQRILVLSAADFPELAGIDLEGSYTALKVFIPSSQEGEPPETIFLGQVHSGARLEIEASVPLSATTIGYEIYSAVLAINGTIALK